ncbi:MAG: Hpt domain-containing protein [Erysipelotrichaceae bacterium]|nr:Hpt domain-containing protein [Erysipelotrichaceae bacterium]MDY5252885.1 Hpt domain-containing protein [Erysipelotrichaceae bacterium]
MGLDSLVNIGVNCDEALERFMQNEKLYKKCLKKLLDDKNFEQLQIALNAEKLEEAIVYAHTLKGVCANLAIEPLYKMFGEMVAKLRSSALQEALDINEDAKTYYEKLIMVLNGLE